MGDPTSSSDARSLRAQLAGLDRIEQHAVAYQWAAAHGKLIDLFGDYAKQRGVLSDIKPKNVMYSSTGDIIVIDAEITKK